MTVTVARTTETIDRYRVQWRDPVTGKDWEKMCLTRRGALRKARRVRRRIERSGWVT